MKLTYGVKKLLSVLSAISIAVCCLPFAAAAADEWEVWGNIKYCIDGETLTVAPKDGITTAAMPNAETAKDVPWYSIRENITLVTIEEGITHIGDYAFYGFADIWNVYDVDCLRGKGSKYHIIKYPKTVKSFGVGSFMNCSKLSTVVLPDNLYSADGAGNYGEIPDSIFEGCSSLVTISVQAKSDDVSDWRAKFPFALPDNINRIGKAAFSGCSALDTQNNGVLNIPLEVKEIDDFAFQDCTKVTYLHLISSIKRISPSAFNGCTSLLTIYIELGTGYPSGLHDYFYIPNSYEGSELFNIEQTKFIRLMPAYSGTEYTFPDTALDTVKEIGDYAFYSSVNLEKITIPGGVKSIGKFAFSKCKNLSEVYLPKSIEKIDSLAFGYYAPNVNVYYDGTKEDFLKIDGAYLIDISVTMHYSAAVGDLHQDGKIDILDLIALKKAIAENNERTDQNDINTDGKLDAGDIVSLRKMILGL